MSFQPIHDFDRLKVFAPRASGLGPIFSMKSDGRKGIQLANSAWSILHAELEAHVLPPPEGNCEVHKTVTKTNTYTYKKKKSRYQHYH